MGYELPRTPLLGTSVNSLWCRSTLVRPAQVGAGQLRWFSRPSGVDVHVLGRASEEPLEREVLHHGSALPVASGIGLHRCQGVFDLFCWATSVLMLMGGAAGLGVVPMLVAFIRGYPTVGRKIHFTCAG
jgi:hypothetical protein